MNINGLKIENKAVLAPMAGFCDIVMRKVCDDYGAGFTVSEMVSARALNYGDKKSHSLMQNFNRQNPYGIQLFGFDPVDFAVATKEVLKYKPDFIDINMGCPAPKIVKNASGSALMNNIPLAKEIARTVVDNANGTPVSVKMRKGWDNDSITALELATACEEVGVSFLTVHGRTRKQMYSLGVDYDIIKDVKSCVNIPVFANGDIKNVEDVKNVLDYTKCDGVMIGRAALSSPWVFKQIKEYFNGEKISDEPTLYEKMQLLLWHLEKLCEVNGETLGMKKSRSHVALYLKGLHNASQFRYLSNSLATLSDAQNLVNQILKENSDV